MSPYSIFIIHIAWGSGGKTRPVLVLAVDENTADIYQITTQYESKGEEIKALYFKIIDWVQAGLDRQSYIDTGTLITLPLNAFEGKAPIGRLTDVDKQRLFEFLNS